MIALDLAIYILSFFAIWGGTGLIISSVNKISKRIGISSFVVSFLVLGVLTSTPELAVGLTSISEAQPEIFIGNLIGGVIILFLLIIPLLAVMGNGIKLEHSLDNYTMLFCLIVIFAPSLLVLDGRVTGSEGFLLILFYLILIYFVLKKEGMLGSGNHKLLSIKSYSLSDILKVVCGVGLVFLSSRLIVDKTILFAHILNVSPFYIGLVGLSLGTNLPELSIAIRAVTMGKKDVAYGDYLGSAAANTLLFGFLTLMNAGEILTENNFVVTFAFVSLSLILFYFFSKSKNLLSRSEAIILLLIYATFVMFEVFK